jgi:hypothetical protein
MSSRVAPSAERLGATAKAFDPLPVAARLLSLGSGRFSTRALRVWSSPKKKGEVNAKPVTMSLPVIGNSPRNRRSSGWRAA